MNYFLGFVMWILSFIMAVVTMVNGYGLKVESWWWLIGGTLVSTALMWAAIALFERK